MIFDKRYIFASSVKSKMLSQMLLLFSFFTSHISAKLVAFFHFIHIIKTGRFKYCLFSPFKYFVFCGKKWFSTKDIFSLLQWTTKCCLRCNFFFPFSPHMFPQNWLLFFMWYVSSKLAASIVAFFLPFKYFVFCDKKWFSTKDISSLLLWGTKCCLRCYFFFSLDQLTCFIFRLLFFTSYVSPKVFAFSTSYVLSKMVACFYVNNNK